MPDAIYTAEEAAELLKTSLSTIRKMLRSGELRGFRLRSEWRLTETELQRFTQPTESKHGQPGTAAGPQPRQRSHPAPPSAPIAVDDWLSRKLAPKTAR